MGFGAGLMRVFRVGTLETGMSRGGMARALGLGAVLLLTACGNDRSLDWDLRNNMGSTAGVAERITAARPTPDANGVISYPDYQVVVARRGDTVASLAARIGLPAQQLASFNALRPDNSLRAGEVLALPVRVASSQGSLPAATSALPGAGVDVSAIATTALDRVEGQASAASNIPFSTQGSGPAPVRYQVKRGETAFTIARKFNVSARVLADYNGLGPDLAVREGQYLIIPSTVDAARLPAAPDVTPPGQGSPLPQPPSASTPLPDEDTPTAAEVAAAESPAPDLSSGRTASSAAQFVMPVSGKITRAYEKKVNDGIDIASTPGEAVKAAAAGVVAAVTKDPAGNPILVLKHAGGLLTVYAGIADVAVAQGAQVSRGQTIAKAAGASVHFEVRQGLESVDPVPYLQ